MSIIFSVPQSHCVVLERFGRFSRVCHQGIHFRVPIFEQIRHIPEWGNDANKKGYLIELTEQQTDTPPRQCHTRDNVTVQANASIYWRILDPIKCLYEVDVLPSAVSDIALNALRSNIGQLDLDSVLSERSRLNDLISAQLSDVADKWGLQFTRVEIQELQVNRETETSMRLQMESERRRRAAVAEALGQAEAELKAAEAEKTATILRAEGQATALKALAAAELAYVTRLSEVVPPESAAHILLAQKVMDGYDKISKNPSHKVFLPNSFHALLSLSAEGSTNGSAQIESSSQPKRLLPPGSTS